MTKTTTFNKKSSVLSRVNYMLNKIEVDLKEKLTYEPAVFIRAFIINDPTAKTQTVDRALRKAKLSLQSQIRYTTIRIVEDYRMTDDNLAYVVDNYFRGTEISASDKVFYHQRAIVMLRSMDTANAFETDKQLVG